MGFLYLIGIIICYVVGRIVISAMGIVMFDTCAGLIIKPIMVGFFSILICLGVIGLFFKLIFKAAPFILIVCLIIALIRRRR